MFNRRSFAGGALACLASPAWAIDPPAPEPPRFGVHPSFLVALGHVRERAWHELAALVVGLPPDSACALLAGVGGQTEVDLDLEGLADAPMAQTTRGALLVGWAWRYRGTGTSGTVTDEMSAAFSERLTLARTALEGAVAADPNDGVAYNFLLRSLKGLGDGVQLRASWDAFQNAARKPIRAYSGMADTLARKWYGSDELMLGFARQYQRALEPASHALICQVANEMLLDRFRRDGLEGAVNFAAQTGVLGEVGAASEAYHAQPTPSDFYQANFPNGEFSFYFSFIGLADHARPFLQAMGDRVSGPWTLFEDDALGMLSRARIAAGMESI